MSTPVQRWVVGLAIWLVSALTMALGYVTDQKSYPASDYLKIVPPGTGGIIKDPVFGTDIKRITNALASHNADRGGNLTAVVNEYSSMTPFNNDNSLILLQHQSYFALYDGQGKFLRDLPLAVSSSSEPRWSRKDTNLLYFIQGNQLNAYNVATGSFSSLRTFTEYRSISGSGESDICFDGDHFILVGDRREIFVYDIPANRKGQVLDAAGRSFDSVYITPDDNVTVTWHAVGSSRYNGIEMYDRNMTFRRQLSRVGGHMDVTRDANGDEVLVMINAADPTPVCDNAVEKIRLSDGKRTCLISLNWSLAVHVSAADNDGWALVSTYAPGDPDPLKGWPTYTNELLQVKLDGTEVRRLAHHRSRPFNSYYYMPRASMSRDGDRLVFSSNYGLPAILSYPADYSDVYMISGLGGSSNASASDPTAPPVSTPVPPTPGGSDLRVGYNDPSVSYAGSWFIHNGSVHSGGAAMMAMDAGSRVTLTFEGTGVKWIGYSDEWSGIANVFVDGVARSVVDTYAPQNPAAVPFSIAGLAPGSHTLVIEVSGTRRRESGGAWVWVDSFQVQSPTSAARAATSGTSRRRP